MAKYNYTQRDSSVFVQFGFGRQPYYLGDCINLDTIPNPRGDMSLSTQWTRARNARRVINSKRGVPGVVSFTLQDILTKSKSHLEDQNCPFNVYALFRCGTAGVFGAWERAAVVGNCEIIDDPLTSVASRNEDNDVMHDVSISGWPPRMDVRKPSISRDTVVETEALLCVGVIGIEICEGVCGPGAIGDPIVGAGGGVGVHDFTVSVDGGNTWAAMTASPFAAGESIMSVVGVDIGDDLYRIIAVRDGDGVGPLDIAYSDDYGVNWVNVAVGAVVDEGATGPKALTTIDAEHIWLATDVGNVYFSDDGGISWELQGSAYAASGAAALNAISAADENVVWAVGDGDVVIYTLDGGFNWIAAEATGSGANCLSVVGFNAERVIVGTAADADGTLWMSYDRGETWEQIGGYVLEIPDMSFINEAVGMMITKDPATLYTVELGTVYQTINGGYNWREISTPDNAGLNSIAMYSINKAFAVGNVESATAVVLEISG